MTYQKALILPTRQGSLRIDTIEIPKPGPGEILIKIEATALNPVDWKVKAYGGFVQKYPVILGGDIAGTVVQLGQGVSNLVKGDRVLTQGILGVNQHAGFQQYTLGFADVSAEIPEELSFEQASTIPLALATAAIGLFNRANPSGSAALYPPWEGDGRGKYEGTPFMIFGGSSSVGQYVIQFAVLAGFSPIITTASAHNSDYLLDLGATHVIDRHLPADATRAAVAKITSAPIVTIYDAVSVSDTQNLAYDLLAPGGCLVLVLDDMVDKGRKRNDKRIVRVSGNTNAPEVNRKLGRSLYLSLTELLAEGDIRPNQVQLLPNGLEGIIEGLEQLRRGVSNIKLVALPQETL